MPTVDTPSSTAPLSPPTEGLLRALAELASGIKTLTPETLDRPTLAELRHSLLELGHLCELIEATPIPEG